MPKPGEFEQAQTVGRQLLDGQAPGTWRAWDTGAAPHVGRQHGYGGHTAAGYVRGDGSVYTTVFPDTP